MASAQDQEFIQIIVNTLEEFSIEFVANREGDAREASLEAALKLVKSFSADVTNHDSGAAAASLLLSFEKHGRFLDMKRRKDRWSSMPPVAAIEQWIYDKGAGKFLSGYKRNIDRGGTPRAIENIAWAIAKTIKEKGFRRRRWYSKKREPDIQRLFSTLVGKYQEYLLRDQKKTLTDVVTKG